MDSLGNTIILLLISCFAYFVEKNLKILFYYKWKTKTKTEWLKSTLDNIQNGLLSLDNNRLHYCNDYVIKKLNFLLEKNQNYKGEKAVFINNSSSFVNYNKNNISILRRGSPIKNPNLKYISQAKSLKQNSCSTTKFLPNGNKKAR